MTFNLENKTITPTTKATPTPMNSIPDATSSNDAKTSTSKPAIEKETREKLLRLRRQLQLESDLSATVDESENLGIEQVNYVIFYDSQSFSVLNAEQNVKRLFIPKTKKI